MITAYKNIITYQARLYFISKISLWTQPESLTVNQRIHWVNPEFYWTKDWDDEMLMKEGNFVQIEYIKPPNSGPFVFITNGTYATIWINSIESNKIITIRNNIFKLITIVEERDNKLKEILNEG